MLPWLVSLRFSSAHFITFGGKCEVPAGSAAGRTANTPTEWQLASGRCAFAGVEVDGAGGCEGLSSVSIRRKSRCVLHVIPMRYGTFPLLRGTPAMLREALHRLGLDKVEVIEMQPGQTM